jgi:hypothetical protein
MNTIISSSAVNANQQASLGLVHRAVVAVAVLLVTPVLALALAPIALLMAPVSLAVLPFVASAFLGGVKNASRREDPGVRRSELHFAPAV